MSGNTKEWLIVALFFACFFAFSVLEAACLNKRNLIPFFRGFAFSFATNVFTISVGFFISFIVFAGLMMLAWDGSIEKLGEGGIRTAVAVASLFPFVLLVLAKRFMIRSFKMTSVLSPWIYSALSAAAFLLAVLGIPALLIYLV